MATGPELSFQDRLGLSFTVIAASISIACVTGILLYAAYNQWLGGSVPRRHDASDSIIFLNLMLADLIQALGVMPNIKWVDDGAVTEGTLCTTQAILKQIGINGVSFTSLVIIQINLGPNFTLIVYVCEAITIYTFVVLVLYVNPSTRSSLLAILGVWVSTGIIVVIPNAVHSARHNIYYGNTGFWCWILQNFEAERVVTEYLWIWITALSMLILYLIMFLVLRGWIIIDNGIHWHATYNHPAASAPQTPEDQEARATARILLFYPGIYILCFLPNTISRWLTFKNHNPPSKFILFANTIFSFSGFFNFIIFFMTRRAMVVGTQVAGTDDTEMRPRSAPVSGFLPPGFPETWESEPPTFPTFDKHSSLQSHISPSHTGLLGTSRSYHDDMEEGPGFLP